MTKISIRLDNKLDVSSHSIIAIISNVNNANRGSLLERLVSDLANRNGRGFVVDNLLWLRLYLFVYSLNMIFATMSQNLGMENQTENYATVSHITKTKESVTAAKAIHQTPLYKTIPVRGYPYFFPADNLFTVYFLKKDRVGLQ